MIEYVAPAPDVFHATPAPVSELVASALASTCAAPSVMDCTRSTCNCRYLHNGSRRHKCPTLAPQVLVNSQFSIAAVEDTPFDESSAPTYNQVRQVMFMAEISINACCVAPANVASFAASASSSAPTPARAVLDEWIEHVTFDGETPAAITKFGVHVLHVNARLVDRTTNHVDRIRGIGTHLTTKARKGGNIGQTRPFASAVRVTRATTHGFRKPPTLYVSKDVPLFHRDVL